jgi:hypothetical protein
MSLAVLYNDARAIWRFNNTWADAKGNHPISNTGAIFDDSYPRLGSHNGRWDGIDNFGAVADHIDFKQNEFTFVGLIYLPNLITLQAVIGKHNVPSKSGYATFFHPTGSQFYFQAGNGSTWPAYNASYAIGSTGWHWVACSHSLTSHKLYIDGYLRISVGGGSLAHNTHDLWFSRNTNDGTYYPSELDEANYFTRQLTDGGISVGQLVEGEMGELWNDGAVFELVSAANMSIVNGGLINNGLAQRGLII